MPDEKAAVTGHVFEITFRVRWNEMDANGHVNNMYYQSYFDEARSDMFTRAGMDLARMRIDGIGPVLYRVEFDYLRELKHPDEAVIRSWMEQVDECRGIIYQELSRASDGKSVCRAKIFGMFYDFRARQAIPFPADVLRGVGLV